MTTQKFIASTFLPLLLLLALPGCNSDSSDPPVVLEPQIIDKGPTLAEQLALLPIEDLTEEEIADILFMREEEKLARDSYDYFYEIWGQKIFDNISNAEQTHIDALILLIDRYALTDPIVEDIPGYFPNTDLQALYDIVAASGSLSLIDALMAGALIEEVDLLDLYIRYDATDNQDIHLIYDSLMKGSRNHLRSFVSNLETQGIIYIPLHLSQEEYDEIINSPMENGRG